MKRPAVEEFIRLTSKPASQWGMADSDVLDLCNYILYLEGGDEPDEHEDPDHPIDDDTEETLPVQDL